MQKDKEIVKVKDLIQYLKDNFQPSDFLCFFDEGGAWVELEHVHKSFIGDRRWMFNRVKDCRDYQLENLSLESADYQYLKDLTIDSFKDVDEDAVVVF